MKFWIQNEYLQNQLSFSIHLETKNFLPPSLVSQYHQMIQLYFILKPKSILENNSISTKDKIIDNEGCRQIHCRQIYPKTKDKILFHTYPQRHCSWVFSEVWHMYSTCLWRIVFILVQWINNWANHRFVPLKFT